VSRIALKKLERRIKLDLEKASFLLVDSISTDQLSRKGKEGPRTLIRWNSC